MTKIKKFDDLSGIQQQEFLEAAIHLWNKGLSLQDIADIFSISITRQRVYQIISGGRAALDALRLPKVKKSH